MSGPPACALVEQWFAVRAPDFGSPTFLDQSDNRAWEGNIVKFLGHLATVLIGPAEKFQGLGGSGWVIWNRVYQDESGARDWP
jgi:hypothetical protein